MKIFHYTVFAIEFTLAIVWMSVAVYIKEPNGKAKEEKYIYSERYAEINLKIFRNMYKKEGDCWAVKFYVKTN